MAEITNGADADTRSGSQTDEAPERFSSLAALWEEHGELLGQQVTQESFDGSKGDYISEVVTFIRRVRATGALLDSYRDRSSAQTVLNYWGNLLLRAGHEPTDLVLERFDPGLTKLGLDDKVFPYSGLGMPEEKERLLFARQELVDECIRKLSSVRLVSVIGPTGSGRSSLVRAGVVPALKNGAVEGIKDWRTLPTVIPGPEPLASLARSMDRTAVDSPERLKRHIAEISADSGYLARFIAQSGDAPAVLVVNKFEQVFFANRADRKAFIDALVALVQAPRRRDSAILVIRGEYSDGVADFPALKQLFEAGIVRVRPFDARELREAIEEPAKKVGLRFQAGLIEQLVDDVQGDPAAIPLLKIALDGLWKKRQTNWLTLDAYYELGGAHMLEHTLDELYDGRMSAEEQAITKRVTLRLARPSAGQEVICTSVPLSELCSPGESGEPVERVVEELCAAGLLQVQGETGQSIQVAYRHEALVNHWSRLVEWLEEKRVSNRRRVTLTTAAEQWLKGGEDSTCLLRGTVLEEALKYDDLTECEKDFLQQSMIAERVRKYRILGWIAGTAALVIFGLLVGLWREHVLRTNAEGLRQEAETAYSYTIQALAYAESERARAESERERADKERNYAEQQRENADFERSRMMVANAVRLMDGQNDLFGTLLWFDDALRKDPDVRRKELHRIRLGTTMRQVPTLPRLLIEDQPVIHAEFTSDGNQFVVVTKKAAYVRDAATGNLIEEVKNHALPLTHASFSPNGEQLVTTGEDHFAKVWDLRSTRTTEPNCTLQHKGGVTYASFSPDGARVVTASKDKTACIWNAMSGQALFPPLDHRDQNDPVIFATFSPDGRYVLTVTGPSAEDLPILAVDNPELEGRGQARIWDAQTGKPLCTVAQNGALTHAAFSPDSKRFVTASFDKTACLWDVKTGRRVLSPLPHNAVVTYASFSPDCRRLVTASRDNSARVWDIERRPGSAISPGGRTNPPATSDSPLMPLMTLNHNNWVYHASFSTDGRFIVTTSRDHSALVWNAETGSAATPLLRHRGAVDSAQFNPDCRRLLTVSGYSEGSNAPDGKQNVSGEVRVWDIETHEPTAVVLSNGWPVSGASASSDGSRLVTWNSMTASVYQIRTASVVWTCPEMHSTVLDAALSSDGKYLITASSAAPAKRNPVGNSAIAVQVWDVDKQERIASFESMAARVRVAVSPNGRLAAISSPSLDAEELKRLFLPPFLDPDHTGPLGKGGKVTVWSLAPVKELGKTYLDQPVTSLAFSPNGMYLVMTSEDDTASVCDAELRNPSLALVRHGSDVLGASFSPDSTRFVTASRDQTARVWDTTKGEPVTRPLRHAFAVTHASFSHDGRLVATAAEDGSVRVWDATTGEPVTPLLKHDAAETLDKHLIAWFSPNNAQLLAMHDGMESRSTIWQWSLADPDLGEDANQFAQVLSGHAIDDTGGFSPLDTPGLKGSWDKLRTRYAEAFSDDFSPTTVLNRHERLAEEAERNGQWVRAIAHLTPLLMSDPNNSALRIRRATAYSNLQRWDNVVSDCTKAIDPMANDIPLLLLRARAYAELSRWHDAKADLLAATKDHPNDVFAWLSLAVTFLATKDEQEYHSACARMLELFGSADDATTLNNVAWACAMAPGAVVDRSKPVQMAAQAVQLTPKDHSQDRYLYLNTLGAAHYRNDDFDDAIQVLQQAMEVHSSIGDRSRPLQPASSQEPGVSVEGTAWDWLFLAMANYRLNRTKEAQRWLTQSVGWIKQRTPEAGSDSDLFPSSLSADERKELEILRHEAESLLKVANLEAATQTN
jgi:WD40 repeat protein/tetratricopeptide (TPR) repeat protein